MACPTLLYPWCKLTENVAQATGGQAARGAVHSGLDYVSHEISKAIASLVRTMMTWWVGVPSVDVHNQPVVNNLREWFLPIAVAVTAGGLMAAGARMAAARKANPLIDVTGGLLVIAITGAIGTLVPNLLLQAGDAWSTWVLDQSIGERFGQRMADLLSMQAAQPGFILVIGIIVLILTAIQALLMVLRETAILILIGLLPLAAAGAMSPGMRGWIKRVAAWLLALIFYKPAAAAVYATAFTLIGTGHGGFRANLMGLCALILSLIALPVLIKLFTFATGSVGQHAGGGILGTAVGAMVAVGSLRAGGGGGSAVAQAAYTSGRIPPPGNNGGPESSTPPSPPTGGDTGRPPSGPGDGGDTPADRQQSQRSPSTPPSPSGTGGGAERTDVGTPSSTPPGATNTTVPPAATATGTTGTGAGAAGATGAAGAGAAGVAGPAAAAFTAGRQAADGARNAAGTAMNPDGSDPR